MTDSAEHPPVKVRYWLETPATSPGEDVEEVSWDTWAAMTEAERESFGESLIAVCIENDVNGGWEVDGPEPPPAPDGPIPLPWGTVLRADSPEPPDGTPLLDGNGTVETYNSAEIRSRWGAYIKQLGPFVVVPDYSSLVNPSPGATP